jgi:hypothetical protein
MNYYFVLAGSIAQMEQENNVYLSGVNKRCEVEIKASGVLAVLIKRCMNSALTLSLLPNPYRVSLLQKRQGHGEQIRASGFLPGLTLDALQCCATN